MKRRLVYCRICGAAFVTRHATAERHPDQAVRDAGGIPPGGDRARARNGMARFNVSRCPVCELREAVLPGRVEGGGFNVGELREVARPGIIRRLFERGGR